jgi:anti-sigma factor (TIGR02949 family)
MRCRQVVDKISEYIDGELDPELVRELERHLEHCEDCRVVVDTTRKTVEVFCHTEPAPLPNDVRERLNQTFRHSFRKGEPN